jgi:hypothetical protein
MRDLASGDAARELGAIAVQLDVNDQAGVDKAIASLPELDVLINNAGIPGTAWNTDDLDADAMREVVKTNVFGLVRVTQAALPLLKRSPAPVIVNVASALGWPRALLDPNDDCFPVTMIPYPSSKAAVIALTVQYAKNLLIQGSGIDALASGLEQRRQDRGHLGRRAVDGCAGEGQVGGQRTVVVGREVERRCGDRVEGCGLVRRQDDVDGVEVGAELVEAAGADQGRCDARTVLDPGEGDGGGSVA